MPKGKKGPAPLEQEEIDALQQQADEANLAAEDNTPTDEELDDDKEPPVEVFKCIGVGCFYSTDFLSEMEEHVNGTGHGGFKSVEERPGEPTQSELFSEKGVVHRMLRKPMEDEFLNDKRTELARLYQSTLDIRQEKKAADDEFNAQLKTVDNQMQEIARVLKIPFTYAQADCEWRIIEEENARGLYRLDTGELVEKQPLSEEDRQAELDQAIAENAQPVAGTPEVVQAGAV